MKTPRALAAVVSEVTRHDAPVQNTRRFVAADGEIAGHAVRAGDIESPAEEAGDLGDHVVVRGGREGGARFGQGHRRGRRRSPGHWNWPLAAALTASRSA